MNEDLTTNQTRSRPRRRPGLLGALLAVLVVSALVGAPDASAGRSWCKVDPLFRVGDDIVDVSLASYEEMWISATGPIKLVLTVPEGVTVKPWYVDSGFGYGYEISYATSSKLKNSDTRTQVSVSVYAPAVDGALPVQLSVHSTSGSKVIDSSVVEGTANGWITIKTK